MALEKLQDSKISASENFWFLKNFVKRIKRAARLFDTIEYFLVIDISNLITDW